jgi:hypothetical protein
VSRLPYLIRCTGLRREVKTPIYRVTILSSLICTATPLFNLPILDKPSAGGSCDGLWDRMISHQPGPDFAPRKTYGGGSSSSCRSQEESDRQWHGSVLLNIISKSKRLGLSGETVHTHGGRVLPEITSLIPFKKARWISLRRWAPRESRIKVDYAVHTGSILCSANCLLKVRNPHVPIKNVTSDISSVVDFSKTDGKDEHERQG